MRVILFAHICFFFILYFILHHYYLSPAYEWLYFSLGNHCDNCVSFASSIPRLLLWCDQTFCVARMWQQMQSASKLDCDGGQTVGHLRDRGSVSCVPAPTLSRSKFGVQSSNIKTRTTREVTVRQHSNWINLTASWSSAWALWNTPRSSCFAVWCDGCQ